MRGQEHRKLWPQCWEAEPQTLPGALQKCARNKHADITSSLNPRALSSALTDCRTLSSWRRNKERRDPSHLPSKDPIECTPLFPHLIQGPPVANTYKTDLPVRLNGHVSNPENWNPSGSQELVQQRGSQVLKNDWKLSWHRGMNLDTVSPSGSPT